MKESADQNDNLGGRSPSTRQQLKSWFVLGVINLNLLPI